jgi:hypothetical protein
VESYIAVCEVLLAADVNPMDISGKILPDCLLCRESFEDDLFREFSSLKSSMNACILLQLGKFVFDRSAYAHRMNRITGVAGIIKARLRG